MKNLIYKTILDLYKITLTPDISPANYHKKRM